MRRIGLRFEEEKEIHMSSEDKIDYKMWLYGTPITDLGKYASLLYGISEVVKDDPSMVKLLGAGVAYFVSSHFYNTFSQASNRLMQIKLLEEIIKSK